MKKLIPLIVLLVPLLMGAETGPVKSVNADPDGVMCGDSEYGVMYIPGVTAALYCCNSSSGNWELCTDYYSGTFGALDADPCLELTDTDTNDNDLSASLCASATAFGTGAEDIDLTLSSQIGGSFSGWITFDSSEALATFLQDVQINDATPSFGLYDTDTSVLGLNVDSQCATASSCVTTFATHSHNWLTFTDDEVTADVAIEPASLNASLTVEAAGGTNASFNLINTAGTGDTYVSWWDGDQLSGWRANMTGPSDANTDLVVVEYNSGSPDGYERMRFFEDNRVGIFGNDRPWADSSTLTSSDGMLYVNVDNDSFVPGIEVVHADTATGGYGSTPYAVEWDLSGQSMGALGSRMVTTGSDQGGFLYLRGIDGGGPNTVTVGLYGYPDSDGAGTPPQNFITSGPLALTHYLRFGENAALPTNSANTGELIAIDDGGGTELWWQTDAGSVELAAADLSASHTHASPLEVEGSTPTLTLIDTDTTIDGYEVTSNCSAANTCTTAFKSNGTTIFRFEVTP